jgi:prepilin-type N-terminal cleavage/methylation domain-containing protein
MNNLRSVRGTRKQQGFTLVEMSVVLVLAGLLVAAVTAGQELINTAKAKKAVNDLVALDSQLQLYAQAKGRFPGDCDADGVIDYAADGTARGDDENNARAGEYAFVSTYPTIPANGVAASSETDACALSGSVTAGLSNVAISGTNANVWLNDLKVAGFVSDSAVNRKLAKMVTEDFLFVGNIVDGSTASESADNAQYNAIVMHNVPQWMAIRMAQAINGQDDVAYRSRLRSLVRSGIDGTYEETWQVVSSFAAGSDSAAQKDAMVTIAYFFDQVPESKESATAD